ncbi:MAG: TonB-dependent receptor, partial [Comamonadaceae bacterium]
ANPTAGYSINVDQAKTYGLELSSRYQVNAAWGLRGGYTHTRSEVVEAGKANGQLANTPRHAAHAQVDWTPSDRSRLWLRGEYRGKSPRFSGDVSNLTGNNLAIYNAVGDIKAHALFHVGGSYQLSKNVSLQANIYNLFDKDFREFKQVNLDGTPTWVNAYFQGGASVSGTTLPGRTFWISANITF